MDPFVSIASRVLYEERVTEGLQRQRRAEFASSLAQGQGRWWQLALLAALAVMGLG